MDEDFERNERRGVREKGQLSLGVGISEVLRQVYVHCRQRGRALEYIWQPSHQWLTFAAAACQTNIAACEKHFKGYVPRDAVGHPAEARVASAVDSPRKIGRSSCTGWWDGEDDPATIGQV